MDFIDKVTAVTVNKAGNPAKEVWMKITVLSDRQVLNELKLM
jgi:peptidyl-prolyl cis-trans isomerase B (cyclophilin B)